VCFWTAQIRAVKNAVRKTYGDGTFKLRSRVDTVVIWREFNSGQVCFRNSARKENSTLTPPCGLIQAFLTGVARWWGN